MSNLFFKISFLLIGITTFHNEYIQHLLEHNLENELLKIKKTYKTQPNLLKQLLLTMYTPKSTKKWSSESKYI